MSWADEYEQLMELYENLQKTNKFLISEYGAKIDELEDNIDNLQNQLDNAIDIEELVSRMKIDGVYNKEFEEWFKNYLTFYAKYDRLLV